MGILEVAQTAQTQLDKLCAETGLPADQFHCSVIENGDDYWRAFFRAAWISNTFMQPTWSMGVMDDGTISAQDGGIFPPRDVSIDACRARAAELAPEPEPFDAELAIRDAGGWMVARDERVVMVGTDCDAFSINDVEIGRVVDPSTAWPARVADPRPVPAEHNVVAVLPKGVYVARHADVPSVFVSTPLTQRSFDTLDDAVRAAVALATQETDA